MASLKEGPELELFESDFWETVARVLTVSLSLLGLTCLVWYVGYVFFYAPSHDLDEKDLAKVQSAQIAVETEIRLLLPRAKVLVKPLEGRNVDIFLVKSRFESIDYPVRKSFVNLVGNSWCDEVEYTFMPSVKIKDIASGETMGEYDCFSIMKALRTPVYRSFW